MGGALALMYDANGGRHLDGANFAYTDGHVKWSKMHGQTVMNMYSHSTPGSISGNSPTFSRALAGHIAAHQSGKNAIKRTGAIFVVAVC